MQQKRHKVGDAEHRAATRRWVDRGILRQFRLANELSQGGLAVLLGVSPNIVLNWELGRLRPSEENMKRISELLGMDREKLLKRWDDWRAKMPAGTRTSRRGDPAQQNGGTHG